MTRGKFSTTNFMNTINKSVFKIEFQYFTNSATINKQMRLTTTSIIVSIILSIIVFIFGMMSHSSFFSWTLPKIACVVFQTGSLSQGFSMSLIYSLTLAAIPFATVLLWRKAKIQSVTNRILIPLVLIFCIAIITALRHFWVSSEIRRFAEMAQPVASANNENLRSTVSLSYLEFEKYMAVGLLVGIVVVYFSMRQKVPTARESIAKSGELE